MPTDKTNEFLAQLARLAIALLNSRLGEVLTQLWKLWRETIGGLAEEGMYEVLEYEGRLELLDKRGDRAQFQKREKVRYLQNRTIAYQDQAWGDGKILLDYRCTPGTPVDQYRPGQKTYILIALRDVKRRGDVDEFHIEWGLRDAFTRNHELWETEVSHRTRRIKVQVVFPANRPPHRILIVEGVSQTSRPLPTGAHVQLPDGRWQITWEMEKPRLYERYALKWDW